MYGSVLMVVKFCCLISSDNEEANQVDVGSIISEIAEDEFEEKLEEIEKVEENLDYVPKDDADAKESLEYR